jgi:outer membrane lipoprotein-sorting protein
MSDLGDLLELMHEADGSFTTFRGEFLVTEHSTVAMRAMAAAMERTTRRSRTRGKRSGSFHGSFFIGNSDEIDADTEPATSRLRIWIDDSGRLREEQGEGEDTGLVIKDGTRWWSYDTMRGAQTNDGDDEASSVVSGSYEHLTNPTALLERLRFRPLGRGERAGRPVVRASAVARAQVVSRPGFGGGADRFEVEVDERYGVILSFRAWFDGDAMLLVEAETVVFDEPLDPATFVFASPDGTAPETEREPPQVAHVALHELAHLAPFDVFVIGALPEGWMSFANFSPPHDRPPRPAQATVIYTAPGGGGTVMLTQQSHAGAGETIPVDRTIDRDGLTLEITERVPGFNSVRLVRGGTRVQITSSELDSDRLIELAGRLQPAPTGPPAI